MKFLPQNLTNSTKLFVYVHRGVEGGSAEFQPHNFPKLDITPQQRAQLPWTTFYRYSQLKHQVAKTASAGAENRYHSTRKRAFESLDAQIRQDYRRIRNHPYSAGRQQAATPEEIKEVYYDVTVPAEDRSRAIDYMTLMRRQAAAQVGVIDTNWNRRAGDDRREAQFITHGAWEDFPGFMTLGQFALLLAEKEGINLPPGSVETLLADTRQRSAPELFRYRYEKISGKTLPYVDKFNVDYISTYYSQLGREQQVIYAVVRELEAQNHHSRLASLEREVGNRQVTYLEYAEQMAQKSGETLDPQTRLILGAVQGKFAVGDFTKSLLRRVPEFSYVNVVMYMRETLGKKQMTVSEYLQTAIDQGRMSQVSSAQLRTLQKAKMKYPLLRLAHEEQKRGTQQMFSFVVNNINRFDNVA